MGIMIRGEDLETARKHLSKEELELAELLEEGIRDIEEGRVYTLEEVNLLKTSR